MPKYRTKAERARDRKNISERYLKGEYQVDIAKALGLSQSTVSRDIDVLVRYWRAVQYKNIDELKRIEIAKINNLELAYWQEWEESKKVKTTKQKKQRGIDMTDTESGEKEVELVPFEKSIKKEKKTGNPAYLAGVQWCIAKRCEILGLNAPTESNVSGALLFGHSLVDLINAEQEIQH